jgi:zinc protease
MPRLLLLTLLVLTVATPTLAAERLDFENGLVLIHDRRPTAPAVSLSAYVRSGGVNEPFELTGASHFVEHMMFRATGRRPEGGSEREVWRVGGQMNAYTHEDFTEYSILVPSNDFPLAVDILSDALLGACFKPEEVEEERVVILEEIRKRRGDPGIYSFDELQALSFSPHPYGRRFAGTEKSIGGMSRDTLHRYYQSCYRPERTVLVLVGDFDLEKTLPSIMATFGAWKGVGEAAPPAPPLPADLGHYQELTMVREGASPTLLAAMTLPGYLHPDYLPSRFLREILDSWVTERLVIRQGVALAGDVYHTPLVMGNQLRVKLNLPTAAAATAARDALLDLLEDLSSPEFDYTGVDEIATNFKAREILLTEDFATLAPVIGRAALSGYYDPEGYPEHLAAADRYERIDAEDLRRVAREWLRPENIRILTLLPEAVDGARSSREISSKTAPRPTIGKVERIENAPGEGASARTSARPPLDSEATRTGLHNGLRLIHLERSGAPVVSGAIVLPAGSRFDPVGKEGLAALTMKALSLATEGDEDGALRWVLYSVGNNHNYSIERDTAQVSFTVPREDAERAMAAFGEILSRPAFTGQAIEEARGRLLANIRRRDERVSSSAGAAFRAGVFGRSPYGHDHRGTEASISALTPEDVQHFYREHYRWSKAVVSLVGEIAPRTARRMVERTLLGPRKGDETGPEFALPEARPPVAGSRVLAHPSGRNYLIVGSSAPALRSPGHAAASLLRLALGWRVFHEFTDVRSTAYDAGSFYDVFSGAGAFGLYVSTSPSRADETRAALYAILDEVGKNGFDRMLIEDARGAWLGGFALATIKSMNVASRIAYRECAGIGYGDLDRIRERIATLTGEDLRELTEEIFDPEHLLEIRVN